MQGKEIGFFAAVCLLAALFTGVFYLLGYNGGTGVPVNNDGSTPLTHTIPPSSSTVKAYDTVPGTISGTEAIAEAVEPLNISIVDQRTVRLIRPVEYYELSNGSAVRIADHNPFPFTITMDLQAIGLGTNTGKTLTLYKVSFIQAPRDVLRLAGSLGVNTSSLLYNNVTETYLYGDGDLFFEYTPSTGFFRVIYKNPRRMDYRSFVENRVLSLADKTLIWRASEHLDASESVNGSPTRYSAVYTAYLNGVKTRFSIVVKLTPEKLVSGIEGVLPYSLEPLGNYSLIAPERLPALLKERIKGEVKAEDWYISKLGFTVLNITEIRLQYMLAGGGMVVPVYRFKGY